MQEVAFLSALAESVRSAAALVDMPCSLLNTDAFMQEAKAVASEVRGITMEESLSLSVLSTQ